MHTILRLAILAVTVYSCGVNKDITESKKIIDVVLQTKILKENSDSQFCFSKEKNKTFFNFDEYINSENVDIPKKDLMQIENSSRLSLSGTWSEIFLSDLLKKNKTLDKNLSFGCANFSKSQNLKNGNSFNPTIKISTPIFNQEKNYAVVTAVIRLRPNSFASEDFLLKKIHQKWIIFKRFNLIMS